MVGRFESLGQGLGVIQHEVDSDINPTLFIERLVFNARYEFHLIGSALIYDQPERLSVGEVRLCRAPCASVVTD